MYIQGIALFNLRINLNIIELNTLLERAPTPSSMPQKDRSLLALLL